jgi:dTDP-4-dehydrorhamnose reductase
MDLAVFGTSTHAQGHPLLTVDILDRAQILKAIKLSSPDCVINCAAMADVEECERNPEMARAVNSVGAKNLAEVCSENGIRLVHVSTDSVFDGMRGGYSEESVPNPLNAYSRTKLEGELFVSSTMTDHVIARTSFYGLNRSGRGLLNWIIQGLVESKEMVGFDDVVFNPLWVGDLASCLVELAGNKFRGALNCAGDQVLSKYKFTQVVADALGYPDARIKKGSCDDIPFLARRPKRTHLLNEKMRTLLKTKIHSLEEVLRDPSFDIYRFKKT